MKATPVAIVDFCGKILVTDLELRNARISVFLVFQFVELRGKNTGQVSGTHPDDVQTRV